MSVFYWGEQPTGTWTLEIENTGNNYNSGKNTIGNYSNYNSGENTIGNYNLGKNIIGNYSNYNSGENTIGNYSNYGLRE